jgi:outer membrane protein TolC
MVFTHRVLRWTLAAGTTRSAATDFAVHEGITRLTTSNDFHDPGIPLMAVVHGRARPLCLIACVACLVGCAHQPLAADPQPALAATNVEHSWNDPKVLSTWRILDAAAQPAVTLSSVEVLAAALNFNPQMALARSQVDLGRAGVLVARQRLNPVLSLTPERVLNAAAGVSPWVAALSLVWPVQTAGKRALAIEQALAMSDASLLNAANTIWNLRASARGALCTAEQAAARTVLVREESALRTDLASRLDKQAAAGVVSRYEAARAHLERDAAAMRLRQSETELNGAKHDLAAVAGMRYADIDARMLGSDCLGARPRTPDDAAVSAGTNAIAARLDLRAKLAEFRAADATWRAELARRYPDLNLGPGYTYDQGDRKIAFTLSGELPIFSHNGAGIARARADRDRVTAEAEVLQDAILHAVARARDQLSAAESQYAAAISMADETHQVLQRDVERQQLGEIDQPAVVVSRIGLLTARTEVLNAQRAVFDAIAALEGAAQIALVPPFFDGPSAQAMLTPPDTTRSP